MVATFVESESKSDLNSLVSKVAIAQVMERVQHTPCFRPGTKTDIFRKVRCFVFSYYTVAILFLLAVIYTTAYTTYTTFMIWYSLMENFGAMMGATMMNLTIMDPTMTDPTMMDPTMTDPNLTDPTMMDPNLTDPTMMVPTMMDPTIMDPNLMDPTMMGPDGLEGFAELNGIYMAYKGFSDFTRIAHFLLIFAGAWYMRHHIRKKYTISGGHCQDCCYAFFCSSCSIAQMMRHTADYDTYVSKCCTETGVPNHAPSIV
jgi:Cys-rich protein (TIGR01571 family)